MRLPAIVRTPRVAIMSLSAILADHVPGRDARCVHVLKQAGGKHNTHEFAYGVTNDDPHWNLGQRPLASEHVSDDASGGSAAAVVAGLAAERREPGHR